MCVLGMAGELADSSIAVNALWPRTSIDTAAVQNLLGGGQVVQHSRLPTIMADSAWYVYTQRDAPIIRIPCPHSLLGRFVLTRLPRTCTGNFFIDDEVLASENVLDLRKYEMLIF